MSCGVFVFSRGYHRSRIRGEVVNRASIGPSQDSPRHDSLLSRLVCIEHVGGSKGSSRSREVNRDEVTGWGGRPYGLAVFTSARTVACRNQAWRPSGAKSRSRTHLQCCRIRCRAAGRGNAMIQCFEVYKFHSMTRQMDDTTGKFNTTGPEISLELDEDAEQAWDALLQPFDTNSTRLMFQLNVTLRRTGVAPWAIEPTLPTSAMPAIAASNPNLHDLFFGRLGQSFFYRNLRVDARRKLPAFSRGLLISSAPGYLLTSWRKSPHHQFSRCEVDSPLLRARRKRRLSRTRGRK